MRIPIELTKESFNSVKNTYIYEVDLKPRDGEKAEFAISLLNYENGRWTYAFYGVRGNVTSLCEGKVYNSQQEAIDAVNILIKSMYNALTVEPEEKWGEHNITCPYCGHAYKEEEDG